MPAPELIIVGGANGSGKTTFASRYHRFLGVEFLNADNIASDLADRGVGNAMITAGRIFFRRLEELLRLDRTFVIETTLSGTYINKVAERARRRGFRVVTIFVFLDDVKLCIERVQNRVLKGGHKVPTEDIVRRYTRSNHNFRHHFTILSDAWLLLYNGGNDFQEVAKMVDHQTTIYSSHRYEQFQLL